MSTTIGPTTLRTMQDKPLLSQGFPAKQENCTIVTGQNLVRGTVVGKRMKTAIAAVADSGNTGDGAISGLAINADAVPGVYKAKCATIDRATGDGTFTLFTPSGYVVGEVTIDAAYSGKHLDVQIAKGATAFDLGDEFDITVSGDGKYSAYNSTATDGTEIAIGILGLDTNATSADLGSWFYTTGTFVKSGITGLDAAATEQLRKVSIFIQEDVQ